MNRRETFKIMAAGAGQLLLFSWPVGARSVGPGKKLNDPSGWTLAAASKAIRNGEISSINLTHACLRRIDAQNPRINAVITAMRTQALAQAAALDAEAKAGKYRSPLHGIPIALKDNIDTADAPTTNASALLKDHIPAQDARVVQLLKQAGAVIIAKTNLAEFAVSPTSATSFFGPVHNPWNPDYISGGSSGGSAAGLAADMFFGALGTDSGGSVRIPSAWCSTVGLKPTLGLVPTTGCGPGIPILDTTGPMARTVEDVAMLLDQIAGFDPRDTKSVERPPENYASSLGQPVSSLRVGVPRHPFFEGLDAQVARSVEAALAVLKTLVSTVGDVTFKGTELPDDAFTGPDLLSYHNQFFPAKADLYQPMTRKVMQLLSELFNDPATGPASKKLAGYARTISSIERRQRMIDAAFDGFDVLVLPTMRVLPPTLKAAIAAENGPKNVSLFSIENTMIFNLLGLPALSLPCGFSKEGLPIGLMICGPHFSEARLLALGAAYERATPWHERRPL